MTGSRVQSDGLVERTVAQALQAFSQRADALLAQILEAASLSDADIAIPTDAETQLCELRAATPHRPVWLGEAMQIAERQADLLRWQLGRSGSAALPTSAVAGLPFLTLTSRGGLSKSALVTKTARGWVLVTNSDEPIVRQRFSLCHELKHILDDPFNESCNGHLYRSRNGTTSEIAERVCDYFAGCLLMPKRLVRRDWMNHLQDPIRLAKRYQVSRAAMDVRLRQLGLTMPIPRCGANLGLSGA